jgi:hypothetical protein
VERSFESFCEKQVHAKKKEAVHAERSPHGSVCALRCPKFPVKRFGQLARIWKAIAARHKALADEAPGSRRAKPLPGPHCHLLTMSSVVLLIS